LPYMIFCEARSWAETHRGFREKAASCVAICILSLAFVD